MKLFLNFIPILFLFSIIISCENDKKKKDSVKNTIEKDSIIHRVVTIDKTKILEMNFSTRNVIKDSFAYGNIVYDMTIDTLTPKDVSQRFVLIAVSSDKDASSIESVIGTAKDGILDSISIDKIDFSFKTKFTEAGENQLKIAIKDIIYLKGKDSLSEYLRNLEFETIYKLPVYVKDSV